MNRFRDMVAIRLDWQTTRDLAPLIGQKKSYGCLHADSWGSVPFPRMPNVSLEPAKENISLEDLMSGIDNGIIIFGNGSWSIDQQRYNFQFGGDAFWEIKGGKKRGMLSQVSYQARTPDFWQACDGIAGPAYFHQFGTSGDAKGEPTQINSMSHGCSAAPVARTRRSGGTNASATAESPAKMAIEVSASSIPTSRGAPRENSCRARLAESTTQSSPTKMASGAMAAVRERMSTGWARKTAKCSRQE